MITGTGEQRVAHSVRQVDSVSSRKDNVPSRRERRSSVRIFDIEIRAIRQPVHYRVSNTRHIKCTNLNVRLSPCAELGSFFENTNA